jgi:beta-glucosidase
VHQLGQDVLVSGFSPILSDRFMSFFSRLFRTILILTLIWGFDRSSLGADLNQNGKVDIYEDSTRPVEERVEDLLGQMTLEEKTCQLATLYGTGRVLKDRLPTAGWKQEIWKDGIANIDEQLNGVPELGPVSKRNYRTQVEKINPLVWPPSSHAKALNEIQEWFKTQTRLGIPADFTNEGIRGCAHYRCTAFPSQQGVGASWNRELVRKIGEVTGKEAKALGYTHIYSPVLDLARDPRWGRVAECYSEDPYLVWELGLVQAKALRAAGVASTGKHFAVYSIPKGGRDGEARTDPHVAPREMETLFLWPWERVIRASGMQGVMSSYNDYDGVPISGSKEFLTTILRQRFGFRGYVVSDSDAVEYLTSKHHVAADYKEACRQYLEAGGNVRTEFNSPSKFILPVRELVKEGKLSQAVLNDRVRDVLRVKFELGLFDGPLVADPAASDAVVHCAAHAEVAKQAARESLVLLKNSNGRLPLAKSTKKILVCGPAADEYDTSVGRYGSFGGEVISVLAGVRKLLPEAEVPYRLGCEYQDERWPLSEILPEPPTESAQALLQDAVKAAQSVEVVIVVLGESRAMAGESKSRTSLDLPGHQNELVRVLVKTGKPVVAVLLNGRSLSVNLLEEKASAILEAWYPGEYGGMAVAEALFGDVNPGGKLPVTFPRSVGQIEYNFPAKPKSQAGMGKEDDPNGAGDCLIEGALYPFGFGLSYTQFTYSGMKVQPQKAQAGQEVTVSVEIKNSGQREGDEVVQLYLRDLISSVTTYEKVLRGFERVRLKAGEKKTLTFSLARQDMELIDRQNQRTVEPGEFVVELGSSSADIRQTAKFQIAP